MIDDSSESPLELCSKRALDFEAQGKGRILASPIHAERSNELHHGERDFLGRSYSAEGSRSGWKPGAKGNDILHIYVCEKSGRFTSSTVRKKIQMGAQHKVGASAENGKTIGLNLAKNPPSFGWAGKSVISAATDRKQLLRHHLFHGVRCAGGEVKIADVQRIYFCRASPQR
jgi:hypothetical protein